MGARQSTRRYRRYLPIPVIIGMILYLQPQKLAAIVAWDDFEDWVGYGVIAIGALWRFWAWGSNARNASSLRTRGPYRLSRHPLYVGNFLLAAGLLMVFNNIVAYALILPMFVVMYGIVTRDEEKDLLRGPVGDEYRAYRELVPARLVPSVRGVAAAIATTRPFDWRLAFEKEYESVIGVAAAALILELYEEVLWGLPGSDVKFIAGGVALLLLGLSAAALYATKRLRTRW